MQKILKRVTDALADIPDHCFYVWTGVADKKYPLVRLDRTYLNIVYRDERGNARFRRMLGCRKGAGTDQEKIFFTPNLVRIQNGRRRGLLMPLTTGAVGENEKHKPAGVSKVLTEGDYPWTFHDRRIGDRQIIELLEGLLGSRKEAVLPKTSVIVHPTFYLVASARNREVRLRDSSEALENLRQTEGYDAMLAPAENMVLLADKLTRPMPRNKLAWPYWFFCRAGVVAADLSTMGNCWAIAPFERKRSEKEIFILELC